MAGILCYNDFMEYAQTKDLDVVYFVKDTYTNEELVYSLRSLERNFSYRRLFIYGGLPQGIKPDVYRRFNYKLDTKWDRVRAMYRDACLDDELSDDFVLFNDDFFVMRKTEKLAPMYRCTMDEHISLLKQRYAGMASSYAKVLEKAQNMLKMANKGYSEVLSYELHIPMIFNKHKLLEVMGAFPEAHALRTIYGNYFQIGGKQADDVNVFSPRQKFSKFTQFLSSDDIVWHERNDFNDYIRNKFDKPSRYEENIVTLGKNEVRIKPIVNYYDRELMRKVSPLDEAWVTSIDRANMLFEKGLVRVL